MDLRLKKILVVEDEENIQSLLKYRLKEKGCVVESAHDGEEALEMLGDNKPDLILLDLMLPGIDGNEFLNRMKGSSSTSDIPVIIMTAKSEEEDILKGFAQGAADYVTKPFSFRVLLARIEAALEKSESLKKEVAQAKQKSIAEVIPLVRIGF